jgi:hypothetical protein
MADKGTLHQRDLAKFATYMQALGYKLIPRKHIFDVARFEFQHDIVTIKGSKTKTHVTVEDKDIWLLKGFIQEKRKFDEQQSQRKMAVRLVK